MSRMNLAWRLAQSSSFCELLAWMKVLYPSRSRVFGPQATTELARRAEKVSGGSSMRDMRKGDALVFTEECRWIARGQ